MLAKPMLAKPNIIQSGQTKPLHVRLICQGEHCEIKGVTVWKNDGQTKKHDNSLGLDKINVRLEVAESESRNDSYTMETAQQPISIREGPVAKGDIERSTKASVTRTSFDESTFDLDAASRYTKIDEKGGSISRKPLSFRKKGKEEKWYVSRLHETKPSTPQTMICVFFDNHAVSEDNHDDTDTA
eukprot:CAMPEP_0178909774 /NCGR_PEP_ID=MMETSP0786-20121207/8723_1 /TAXON_ID=186022 /ORGANISM="Thalassionema frauenfeldii, Strain CCMP 1798" /LENGTH=184 /DNA_ID=CAMNT_0020581941 /DNA_START=90 /DNA_END=644 /DNA_ORIENTATION=-